MSIKLADSQLVMLSAAPQRKDRCLSPRDAHRWLDKLTTDADQTIEALAAREGKTERSVRMTLSLAFLSPTLAKARLTHVCPAPLGPSA